MVSFAQTLRDHGFSYLSMDMATTSVRLTAWRANERKTYQAYAATVEAAEAALIAQLSPAPVEEPDYELEDLL